MKRLDVVIVGFGIAGASIARELRARGKRILVIDAAKKSATAIAGGTIHPAVLRYYNKVWRADEFWPTAKVVYQGWEQELGLTLLDKRGLMRLFDTEQEREIWQQKREDPFWRDYLNPLEVVSSKPHPNIMAPFGTGNSDEFWRFDPAQLLDSYRCHLIQSEQYIQSQLVFDDEQSLFCAINDLGYETDSVVLAQGHQQDLWPGLVRGNPILSKQGQYLIIDCPGLNLTRILKSKFFVIPLGHDRYQVGATYPHNRDSNSLEAARDRLLGELNSILKKPFKVREYWTGIRPGTKDRKPILGALNTEHKIYVYNGLNSRGLLMAPLLSSWLANFMLEDKDLPKEISINRFF